MRGRIVLIVLAVAALSAVIAAVGHWESRSALDEERERMMDVWRVAGGELLAPGVSDYYDDGWYTCFRYWAGDDPFALSACFDPNGRYVEAVDARSGRAEFHSIRYQPAAAPMTVDPAVMRAAMVAINRAQERLAEEASG